MVAHEAPGSHIYHRPLSDLQLIQSRFTGSIADQTLQTLYFSELKDLYSAEQQLVKALPKIVKAVESEELSDAIANHLEETKNQVRRLEQIFESLGKNPKGKKRVGMQGILEEGSETIDEFEGSILDAGVISAAQRVEHYEMAAYGSVCAYAELLQRTEDLGLLKETLEEEKNADEKLTQISETIDRAAIQMSSDEDTEVDRQAAGKVAHRSRKTRSAA